MILSIAEMQIFSFMIDWTTFPGTFYVLLGKKVLQEKV